MKISISVNLEMTEAEGLKLIEEEYKPHYIKPKKNTNNSNIRNIVKNEISRQLRDQMNQYQYGMVNPLQQKNR